MQPLNPFLRAFFRSALPAQCSPIHHHILLVPTTDVLLNAKDRDTNTTFADLAATEDFLASHVLRVPGGIPPGTLGGAKDLGSVRENKGRPKQYPTINGRTVIIKDAYVYSNKGFKTLNQAQLLQDIIYYPSNYTDGQQWLVYYISRPLLGTFQHIPMVPAVISDEPSRERRRTLAEASGEESAIEKPSAKKKIVKDFADLMHQYPMISKQLQGELENIIRTFVASNEAVVSPKRHSRSSSVSSQHSTFSTSAASIRSSLSAGSSTVHPTAIELAPAEVILRDGLETAVNAAIASFQDVDKAQLSLLGSNTDLTGPAVEQMIERYLVEQVHDRTLFPRVCALRRAEDNDLDGKIRRMTDIDIAQVGIPVENGMMGKRMLAARLAKGVETFKRMGASSSPQEMLEILLSAQKAVTEISSGERELNSTKGAEKPSTMLTINADLLVSLLLIVIVRSGVRHLHSRLLYMRFFIFTDEVESGERGYALATMEAVLAHLSSHAPILRTVSRSNRALWQAVRNGAIQDVCEILQTDDQQSPSPLKPAEFAAALEEMLSESDVNSDGSSDEHETTLVGDGELSHVFPWQRPPTPPPESGALKSKMKKRVSLASLPRSQSGSSGYSSRSHSRKRSMDSSTLLSHDLSPKTMAKTQDADGNSLLMMATEAKQRHMLRLLLGLSELFPVDSVLGDMNTDGTTLLMAATISGDAEITNDLIRHLSGTATQEQMAKYLVAQDSQGRTFAHYLFHQPSLIRRFGKYLPWTAKDKNGQTPLFALCRSYDHEHYHDMVDAGLRFATDAQPEGAPLHLDEHVDGKGNTLLHIVHDPSTTLQIMCHCNADVNAANEKRFTPLMIGSKYGRIDQVRVLLGDPRVDMTCKDLRGLTAVELAKDDEVRNRIDDLVLLALPSGPDGRTTQVVRSFFVEDATIRLVLKSGLTNSDGTVTVTTCRRSVGEFEDLARLLSMECPASWLPTHFNLPSPFMIPSRPSRTILRDIQLRLDNFLRNLLTHGTFRMHELVWEFFLVPDLDASTIEDRSRRKAEARVDNIKDDFEPINDLQEVENFVAFAREQMRGVTTAVKKLLRDVNRQRMLLNDLAEAATLTNAHYALLLFVPEGHLKALERYVKTLGQSEASPMAGLYYHLHSMQSSSSAIQVALDRPAYLIGSMSQAQRAIDRSLSSISRSNRWTPNMSIFEDARRAVTREAWDKAGKARGELETLSCELRYTQQTVASELAVWQEEHVLAGKKMLRTLAKEMIVREKVRLEGMKRALRGLQGLNTR